eukprot:9944686-Alexandrium_andersonii.AAC.1
MDGSRGAFDWDLYMARCPKCKPLSTEGPSVLQSASIRKPRCVNSKSLQAFEPRTARAQERPQNWPPQLLK